MDLNIPRVPKKAQDTPKQDLSTTFMANSLAVVRCRLLVSRMNPSDPNRQKTAARNISNELFGKVLHKVALPVQFLQFMLYPPMISIPPQRCSREEQDKQSGGDQYQHDAMVEIIACGSGAPAGCQGRHAKQNSGQSDEIADQRNFPVPGDTAQNSNAAPEQKESAYGFDNRGGNDFRLMKPAE
jgi:hypothetical protein